MKNINYRLTPLHFLALVTIVGMICEIIKVSKINGDPGLGGFGPYVMFGLTFIIIFIDLFLQILFKRLRFLLIIEICLIAIAVVYYCIEIY
jgi:hypothetical protein